MDSNIDNAQKEDFACEYDMSSDANNMFSNHI